MLGLIPSGADFASAFSSSLSASVKPGHVVGAGGHRDRRALEVVADRLEAAAELLGQERFGDGVERLVVLRPVEAVAFVRDTART